LEDLDSKANFDLAYQYRIETNAGGSNLSIAVNATTIYFCGINGAIYNFSNTNRRTCTAGWVITKILKKKF
jgi:hypothetical protein